MRFDVHIYAVVRVPFKGIEAKTAKEAAQKAEKSVDLHTAFRGGEYAEQLDGFLVDLLNDNGDRINEISLSANGNPTPTNIWGEDTVFTRCGWKHEVANGDTNLGYWDWVEHQRESSSVERLISEVTESEIKGRIIARFQPQIWVNNNAQDNGPVRYFDITEAVEKAGKDKTLQHAKEIIARPHAGELHRSIEDLVFNNATGLLPLNEPHTGSVDHENIAGQIVAYWEGK